MLNVVALYKQNISAYMVDLMALIWTLQAIPETYEELSKRLFEMLPSRYPRIELRIEREGNEMYLKKFWLGQPNPNFQGILAIFWKMVIMKQD